MGKHIIVGKKVLKQYDLRIVGTDANYPFDKVAFAIEQMINKGGNIIIDEGKNDIPVRVHIFSRNKPMLSYELGHDPIELSEDTESSE